MNQLNKLWVYSAAINVVAKSRELEKNDYESLTFLFGRMYNFSTFVNGYTAAINMMTC